MDAHLGFIAAAYGVTGVVVAGMLLAVLLDHRAQIRSLAMLADRLQRETGGALSEAPTRGIDDHEP